MKLIWIVIGSILIAGCWVAELCAEQRPSASPEGTLVLQVEPRGSAVSVNGIAPEPATDFQRQLAPGFYHLTVSAEGFESRTETVSVLANTETVVRFSLAAPRSPLGILTLQIFPDWAPAAASLDQVRVWPKNETIRWILPGGSHELVVEAPGFELLRTTVSVAEREEKRVELSLKSHLQSSELAIRRSPAEAAARQQALEQQRATTEARMRQALGQQRAAAEAAVRQPAPSIARPQEASSEPSSRALNGPEETAGIFREFPSPPPAASASYVLRRDLFNPDGTLGEASERILSALDRQGYVEHSFFSTAADGIALVTRLERMKEDGSPADENDRWVSPEMTTSKAAPQDVLDLLRGLFYAQSGHYRIIVFIFRELSFSQSPAPPTEKDARDWLRIGLNVLPADVASQKFGNRACTALIYEFESDGTVVRAVESRLTGRRHLVKAGIISGLEPARSLELPPP